jgi:arabinofuranan 3-O-arabinosyltransferase
MPSDSKLYLYLDPGRFMADAASTFDPRQFAGWVPHQHVSYLWPAGPWFWLFDTLGVPDWIAHRLWIGTLMVAAGLGVRWCARLLGLGPVPAAVAAIVYQLSPYVLPYVSRTSVLLLPWAGLGWIVGFTIRATRRRTWGDPAAIALVVFTVGSVNATALAMIIPAPTLWLVHAAWSRSVRWRAAALVAVRVGVLSIGVSMWWIVMLSIQGKFGADVLPYSESLADVSLTATSPEVWRSLGYWLFYIRDPYAATTTESLRYVSSTPSILVSYLVPIVCLTGLTFVRWPHRRFSALLVGAGAILAVGLHPLNDESPLMRLLAGNAESGVALALRSSTRALPVMTLGLALAAGSLVGGFEALRLPSVRRPRFRGRGISLELVVAGVVVALAVVNLPSLWNGAFVDPALARDQDPPEAWREAAAMLDRSGSDGRDGRVLQLPGAEFGAFRWGYTVDQPLPGLTEKPLVTRDLLPLGSAGAMDLLFAFDNRLQDGVLEPASVAPIARLLGVDTIWLANDLAYDRFQTARPPVVSDLVGAADGVSGPSPFGELTLNIPDISMTDERALGDPRVGQPVNPVELFTIDEPGAVVRAANESVVVSGSGDGLVDLAASSVLTGDELIQYSASLDDRSLSAALSASSGLYVTDSNRDRAHHWRSSQDTTGYTEPGGAEQDVLRPTASDRALPVFEADAPDTQTTALQRGPLTATATSYGEPFAYLPEHRPYAAVDGDPDTAWLVGEHADPIGEMIRITATDEAPTLNLRQPATDDGDRRIGEVSVRVVEADGTNRLPMVVALDERSLTEAGQPVAVSLPPGGSAEITITEIATPEIGTAGALAGVGFAEISTDDGPTLEIVRPPHDGLDHVRAETPLGLSFNRLRTDPMDRWRDDPEVRMVREFELPTPRTMSVEAGVRIDARASDAALASLFGWSATASTRLTGSPRNAGVSALDGDADTSWVTAFGEALGATLSVTGASEPITSISVRQPVSGLSRITRVAVRTNGDERVVDLVPDAGGTSTAAIDPALTPGDLELQILGVESALTVDRRFGDVFELPTSIIEFEYTGRRLLPSVSTSAAQIDCTPLLSIDGNPVEVSLSVSDGAWVDGEPLAATICDPSVVLTGGEHLAVAIPTSLPVTVDRLTLSDAESDVTASNVGHPATKLLDSDRFSRSIEITGCETGCWLVFGEGFSPAWKASGPEGDLGGPVMVDGGFNGWWIEPTATPILVTVAWTQQGRFELALLASLIAVAIAIGLLVLDHRRSAQPEIRSVPPVLVMGRFDTISRSRAVLTWIVWSALAGLIVAPLWAIWGALAGLAVIGLRRSRLPELVAIAAVAAIGAAVVLIEFREATVPNGAWPLRFESLHRVGLFAVASLIVGAALADDSAPGNSDDETSHDRDGET